MPAWDWGGIAKSAVPVLTGIFSTAGDIYANENNRAEAERNRQFQERMSSTAVQRSVEDYKKAGLNPGLAYERSASSPGGTTAMIGNPMSSGIASANQAKQMQILKEQAAADLILKREQARAAGAANTRDTTQAQINVANTDLLRQQFNFNRISQPHTLRLMEAEAVLKALGIPEAKNKADFEEMLGKGKPGLASAKTFAEIMKIMFENRR